MKYEFLGTPAPWRIAAKDYKKQYYVIHGTDTPTREVQVLTINYGYHPIKEQLEGTKANAHLIAAAPDLLAACIEFLKVSDIAQDIAFAPLYKRMEYVIEKALNTKN